MGVICFEVDTIPDLSLNKYQTLADTGIEGVLKRHESFLRQWHGIGMAGGISFHLLYMFIPQLPAGERLKLYLMLQGSLDELKMTEPLLHNSPLSDFYTFKYVKNPHNVLFKSGATLFKKEAVADINNPLTGKQTSVYYVPHWEVNDQCRLYDLFRIMQTVSESYSPSSACAFRIDIYPASISQETKNIFNPILKSLRGENDIKLMNNTQSIKTDNDARDVCSEYENWLTCIETTPHFRVNIHAFTDTLFKAKVLLNAAGAEALNEGDFSIAPIKPDSNGYFSILSRMGGTAEDYTLLSKQTTLTCPTTFTLNEVVPFFRLPVLFDGETIEIPKETAPKQVPDGLYLGQDMNQYPVNFALKDLPRHAFFTGMPGSGKTNTMFHLVTQLKMKGIPFLVLEPAKKEYRALLGHEMMKDVYLFSPHLQSHFPLQMNPMEFPKGVRLSEHINALLEVFEGTFVLEGPTYKFLSSSIERAYTKLGWDIEDINTANTQLPYPTLQDVYDILEEEIKKSSYSAELKGNVRAFLQVRLGGLMERDVGELFNAPLSTLSPEEWLTSSAIVELEVLGEQAKNFFVLLVCHYILESLRVNPHGGQADVRHALFIEEAHNIIASSTQQESGDTINPKVSATAYIVKMLAEVRALREAIIIADQLPTALTSEVTKNTGLKLVHRLTSQDDRQQIGTAISASPLQLEQMAAFTTGKALIYHERTQKPFAVQIAEWRAPKINFDITRDEDLYCSIYTQNTVQRAILIAFRNWQEKCLFKLNDRVLDLIKRYGKLNSSDIVEISLCKAEKEMLLHEYDNVSKKCRRFAELWFKGKKIKKSMKDEYSEVLKNIELMKSSLNNIIIK